MAVIHHTLASRPLPICRTGFPWFVFSPREGSASPRAAAFVRACATETTAPGPRISLAGLAGVWSDRAGRTTRGFVAIDAGDGADAAWAGLVVVAESETVGCRRFSLAWLLVHPAVRRRGVATALVCHALEFIHARGGTEASVESLTAWPPAVAFWRHVADGLLGCGTRADGGSSVNRKRNMPGDA
jgi:GNAT superfamily N-acetyltransferase